MRIPRSTFACKRKEARTRRRPSRLLACMRQCCPLFVFIMDRGSWGGDLQVSYSGYSSSNVFTCGAMNGNSSTLFPPRYPGERYDDDGAIPFHKRSYFFHLIFILQTIVQTSTIAAGVSFNRVVESTQGCMVVALAVLVVWEDRLVSLHRHFPST